MMGLFIAALLKVIWSCPNGTDSTWGIGGWTFVTINNRVDILWCWCVYSIVTMIVLMKMLVMYKYVYYIYIQLITLIMFDSFPCLSQFLTDCWLKILYYILPMSPKQLSPSYLQWIPNSYSRPMDSLIVILWLFNIAMENRWFTY
jgi:hypothetical protein